MNLADTLIWNKAITFNDPRNPKSVQSIPLRHICINLHTLAIQLTNFFQKEECLLIIDYVNSKTLKSNDEKEPSQLQFINSNFAKIMEMRLTEIGLLPPVIESQKKIYKFARINPLITVVMQTPGTNPQFYEPTQPAKPNEIVTLTGIGYLDAYQKGKTDIYESDGNRAIDSVVEQYNGSLFIYDARRLRSRESLCASIKYYLYFDIIYENNDQLLLEN